MALVTIKGTAVQMRKKDSDSRWRSRQQETEHEIRRRPSTIVAEELPEILSEVEEKVADRLQRLKQEEKKLITEREAEKRQDERQRQEKKNRAKREKERSSRTRNEENEEKTAATQEQNLKERLENEETDKAFREFQMDKNPAPLLSRCNSIRDRLRRFERKKAEVESLQEAGESSSAEENIDLQSQLEEIDSGKQGYDPEKERELHEKADNVFKNYQARQKRSSSLRLKRRPSIKATKLVKSLTFEEEYSRAQDRVMIRKSNPKRMSLEGEKGGANEHSLVDGNENGEGSDDGVVRIDEGHVKRRMQLFRQAAESEQKHQEHSMPKTRVSLPRQAACEVAASEESNIEGLKELSQEEKDAFEAFRNEERKAVECKNKIASLRLSNRMEEALEQEENYHAAALAISRSKRRLLRFGIEVNVVSRHGRDSIKLMRQSKVIADVSSHSISQEQEDVIIEEGHVGGKIKNFQE